MDESVQGRGSVEPSLEHPETNTASLRMPQWRLMPPIVIESDPGAELRRTYLSDTPGSRCTVIGGDPRRIL